MPAKTQIFHPGKPGRWPGGEPQSVRDAYDALLTQGKADGGDDEQSGEDR